MENLKQVLVFKLCIKFYYQMANKDLGKWGGGMLM